MKRKITLLLMGLIWLSSQSIKAQCTPGDLDSDADGICDIEDLDDDNDGILDSRETVCSASLTNFTFYGQGVSSVDANTIYLTSNNAWRTSYSNETISLPIHLEYRVDRSRHIMTGLLPLNGSETITNWNDAAYKLYTYTNNWLYAKLTNQWTFALYDYENKLLEMDIDEAGKLTITMDGQVIHSGNAPVTDYRLAISSYQGGSINDFLITHKQANCNIQDIDTDGDNIPDRLDLDSDDDRCVDAFEGDATFGLNDMDSNGRLTGGVDTNPGSLTYGVPLSAGQGQGVGESMTKYTPLIETRECICIASNNPTDSDNDGICDEVDVCDSIAENLVGTPCNDGDNATINDVWDNAACGCVGTRVCVPGDPDTDADGICDVEDMDDDNDGILDTKESICNYDLTSLNMYGNAIDTILPDKIVLNNNNAWRSSYSTDVFSLPIHLEFLADNKTHKMIGFLPLGHVERVDGNEDSAYKLYTHTNNRVYCKLPFAWTFNTAGINNQLLEMDIDLDGNLSVKLAGQLIHSTTAPISDYRLAVSSHTGAAFNELFITHGNIPCEIQEFDTDSDGTPNRIDLDSDGDDCADSFEGDGTFGLNDMDGNGRLTGGVNTNPASPVYGAPIVVDTLGQGVGESTTASFPLVDFRECKCLAANNPTDTDGDGICDEIDICPNLADNLIGTPCNDGDSNTINDVWDGIACACAGTPTCTPGTLDTDADGVCDIEDLDDDNDGILDENETICSMVLSDLTMVGNAIDSILPDRILLTNNNGWRSSYSEDTLSLPFHLEFLSTADYYRTIGFMPIGTAVNVNSGGGNGDYSLYPHVNGRLYGRFPSQWTFQPQNIHNKMISMDVDISGNVNVLIEGDTIYTGSMPVLDYRLVISSNNGGSFEDVVLSYANMPCTVQDLDTDGDGTPNRLDLDSDDDRCVDAFEGDATFGLNDMDADGRLTGGVDLTQGSATYGVPLSAGTTGQGIGESTNPYTPLIDTRECLCIASNNPTDADNDGICDDIDACDNLDNNLIGTPCNDGDNTTVSDVWTIGCNCVGVTACTAGDLDSDTDGICDLEDLDDDNDGIPDKEESICSLLPTLSMYGNGVQSIDADSIVLTANNGWRSSYSSDILSLPLHLDFMADLESDKMIGFLPLGLPETVSNWNDASYKIRTHSNGNMYAKIPTEWTYIQGGIDGKRIDLDIDVNGNLTLKVGGQVVYTGTAPVSDYRFVATSHSGGTFKGVTVQYGNLPCIEMDSDSDTDGTPNRLDLDSDGDVCVDAFEGDASLGLNDMDANGRLIGSVDLTQGSPAYGIPLSAGSGQGAGESTAASFPFVETRECMCIASNNPVDTDNDGVCDAIDLCANIDDNLIGTPCDDGDVCTVNDVWKNNCECAGIFVDSDGDQICDVQDTCPDFDDAVDMDNDGITDCLDTCIDVNDNDVCDSAELPFVPEDDLLVAANRRRGYYTQPFTLDLLANNPNATIYYTLDGSEPDATDQLYDGTPIQVDSTTVVRVVSYAAGDTSKVVTFSYLFAEDMLQHPDQTTGYRLATGIDASIKDDPYHGARMLDAIKCLPTVSVVMDTVDFNAYYYEKEIQSPVSIELLYPDGTDYQQNGGVEAYGNSTFGQAKKNFRFLFKQEFGESKFRYPIFGEDAADDFDYWVLRAGGQETTNRGGAQNLNDQVFRDLQLTTSGSASHGDFFHVTVNGIYWGVYNAAERPQKSFGESYFGGDKDDWNTMKGTCCDTNERAIDGDLETYDNLLANINDLDSAAKYLDIDHYIDYVMINNYGPHGDWRTWNTYAVDNPVIGEPIRFFIWDAEPSMASDWYYITTDTRTIDMNDIYDPLMAQLEFRVNTGDHMECNCFNDGALTPTKVKELYQYWFDKTEKAFLWETGRWQGIDTYEKFVRYKDRVFAHIDARTDTLVVKYREAGLYPSIDAVQFSQYGGAIPNGFSLNMTNPNSTGTIYYTTDGTDPRLEGGGISPTAQVYNGSMSLSGVTTIKARVFDGTEWSAMCPRRFYGPQNYQDIVINEIMYHPDSLCAATDSTELDYIELLNAGTQPVDLIDCKFTDGISYEFSDPMILQPGDFLVLAENIDEFVAVYGFAPYDQYKGGLDNSGETIKIADPFGNLMDSVKYNDRNPWDEDPDGNGPSLELLNPTSDNADPISWFRSDNDCGTPAAPNSRVCTGTSDVIVINEINYNSNNGITDPGDWVELYNPTANAIDISDWTFYDNNNEFIFPAGTVMQPDEYLVLVEGASMFTSIFPHLTANDYLGDFGFGLSNKGERVSLFNKDKCLSDYVVYNDRVPWDTIPDGNGPTLSLITPNSDNTLPQSWESSSNINSGFGTPGRANEPCLEQEIMIPDTIYTNIDTLLTVDNPNGNVTYNWFIAGVSSAGNTNTDSVTVNWVSPGTYNIQLITNYFECTKVSFKQVVVVPQCVDVELYAYLEGAYNPSLGEMTTRLSLARKLLPGQTPVSNIAIPTPAGQPYHIAPWNYNGTEGANWTDADYTGDETDWVLASFRTGTAKNTEVGITAGLLMKNGLVEFPNRCALTTDMANSVYIVLEHRNHIGVMTPQPIDLIGSTLTYDFRWSDSFRDPTSFGQKQLPTGEWTLFAGDADQSDFPSFDIKGTDKTIWFDNNGIFDYYFSPDFNLDGDINGQDKSLWFDNNGISSRVPK